METHNCWYFHQDVLRVYEREFVDGLKLKFVHHEVIEGQARVIEDFEHEAKVVNYRHKFQSIVNEADTSDTKWNKCEVGGENCAQRFMELMDQWFIKFLREMDNWIEEKVSKAVLKTSKARCEIKSTVYNFSSKTIDDKLLETLNLGGNYILHNDDMDEDEALTKLEKELFNYVISYRKYIQKMPQIDMYYLKDWLNEAINTSEVGEHKEFYEALIDFRSVKVSRRRFSTEGNPDFRKLDKEGIAIIECDKNCGIAILDIKEVVEADERMVEELGGKKCEGQPESEVKMAINSAINNFENELSSTSNKYLNTYYPERRGDLKESVMPYLKLKAKVHKLNEHQLEKREVKKLKYRPVIDSSRTPIHHYSKALRNYIKDLTTRLEEKFFKEKTPLVKNGIQVSRFLSSLEDIKTEGTFMAIADLASAYSFIFVGNLKYALKFAARALGIPEWKDQLFQEMASLILENSYVETSGGIFKLGPCLPMGLGMSGESLDLVCLVSEIGLFGKEVPAELSRCSELYSEWGIEDETKLMDSVIKYFRYRDDTFTLALVNGERTPKETIMALGSAFLTTLDVSFNLTHFVGSYLDCYFYKKLSGTGFVRLVRRKGKFPITYQHASSNYGDGIVRSIVHGEILRHRRLCSTTKLTNANDICLTNELESRGYIRDYVTKQITERIEKIGTDYDENYEKKTHNPIPEGLVYGANCKFDSTWLTHKALKKLLRNNLMITVKLPTVIPGARLRTKYYTKARYLKMAKKHLNKKD